MELTRYGKNILDLVLCNDRLAIFDLKVTQPFSTSDHDSIIFKLRSSSDSHNHIQNGRRKYNFKLADWDNLAADLSQVDWENLFNCSIDQCWSKFYVLIFQLLDKHVPLCRTYNNKNNIKQYPYAIKKLLNAKAHRWRILRMNKNESNKKKYLRAAAESRDAIYNFVRTREENIIESGNLGKLYKYANKKMSSKNGIGVIRSGNEFITEPRIQATLFNEVFAEKFVVDNGFTPNVVNKTDSGVGINYVPFPPLSILKNSRN